MRPHTDPVDDSSPAPKLSKHILWRWFKRLYVAATLAMLAWATASAWPVVQQWQLHQLLPATIATIAGWIGMVLLLGRGWADAVCAWSGLRLGRRQWLPIQAAAWAGRYLPGKIGLLAGKMQACEQGISWKQLTGSVISEQLAFIGAGLALSGLATRYWQPLLPAPLRQTAVAYIAVLLLPALAMLVLGAWLARKRLPHADATWGLRLILWSALGHIAAGTGFHFLLASLLADPPSLLVSIGLLAVAHTAGVLAIFAPAGLGVREAVIAAALAPQVGWSQALAITALQRALVVIADGGIAAGALLIRQCPPTPHIE